LTPLVDQLVSPSAEVLEFGSGASTLWWAERGNDVSSVEIDEKWASRVQEVSAHLPGNVNLHLVDDSQDPIPSDLVRIQYDFVSVGNLGDEVA
jgi:16S rRNA A1518/A1519 N6-dimethyltransferase RsmA/KsgA/DIM1 with predicted DNA glycosylase/AP lyase activity